MPSVQHLTQVLKLQVAVCFHAEQVCESVRLNPSDPLPLRRSTTHCGVGVFYSVRL